MSKKYDLENYKYSKKVVKDIPDIIKKLEICYRKLYPYREYYDVDNVIWAITDAKFMLELGLKRYEEINNNKGEIK